MRARGLATELVDAARITGRHPEENPWCLMQVEDVAAENDGKRVKLKGLELETELLVICVVSPDCNLEKNDIVSVADEQISYFNMTVFKPRTVAARQTTDQPLGRMTRLRSLVTSWIERGTKNPEHIAELLNKSGTRCPWGGLWTWMSVMRLMKVHPQPVSVGGEKGAADSRNRKARGKRKPRRSTRLSAG